MELRQLFHDPPAWNVLVERARALALHDEFTVTESGAAILSFRLGENSYSLPATSVREVQPLGVYTPLPAVPSFVVGLVNVRGRLLTVIDLRPLLGLPPAPPGPGAQQLIISVDDSEISLLADSVVSVRHSSVELSPTPTSTAGRALVWVRGVDADLSIHIAPDLLFADPALLVNAEAEG